MVAQEAMAGGRRAVSTLGRSLVVAKRRTSTTRVPNYPWNILKTGWLRWRHLARRNTRHPRPRPRADSRAMHSTLAGSRFGAAGPPIRAADALFASEIARLAANQSHGREPPLPLPFDHLPPRGFFREERTTIVIGWPPSC